MACSGRNVENIAIDTPNHAKGMVPYPTYTHGEGLDHISVKVPCLRDFCEVGEKCCRNVRPHWLIVTRGLIWFEPDTDQCEDATSACHRFSQLRSVGIYLGRVCEEQPDVEVLFDSLPRSIDHLEVFNTLYPDYAFAKAIAKSFSELRVLRLAQPAIWCSLCFTCNIPSVGMDMGDERAQRSLAYRSSAGLPVRAQIFVYYHLAWATDHTDHLLANIFIFKETKMR